MSEVTELKKLYRKRLRQAQRKFNRELNSGSNTIEFIEAVKTGGQFSFKNAKTVEDVYNELYRANVYLNTKLMTPEKFIEGAKARGEDYVEMFNADVSYDEKIALGFNEDLGSELYEVYRRLQEQEHGQIGKGGLFESNAFLAYLYSYLVDGHSKSYTMRMGNDLLSNAHTEQRRKFMIDVPVEFQEQEDEIPDEYNDRGGKRFGKSRK